LNLKKKSSEIYDQTFYLSDNISEMDMIELILEKKFKAVISTQNVNCNKDFKRAKFIEENKNEFFKSPERFLFNENSRYKVIVIENSNSKLQARKSINSYGEILNSIFLEESIHSIFEELFMNAIYDAPREAGVRDHANSTHPVELIIGDDGENLVISCLDYYGSLNPKKFLSRLFRVLKYGAGVVMNMDSTKGGAGIGGSILFGCSSNLIIAVYPKKYTRVTCIIPLKTSRVKFSKIIKNIQLVVI
jgi:hypothetical protein